MNGDFSSKLDALLSNPAMMAQIKALADTMTDNGNPPPSGAGAPPGVKAESETVGTKEATSAPAGSTPPNDTAAQAAFSAKAAGAAIPTPFSPSPAIEKNIKNTRALLLALKPYLDAGRCEKIDKMLNMMRLAEMAGYFKNLL